ncbi:mevalonate kinase [Alkalispirochaeta alkalica]|uniref:mevalonate kinase n=1 Tax=Alkalispirochaeta alkalica TaxID=46356 RepID=UPI000367D7F7|nr:mevalonate kinase [Alkalispirochaeta alkalica]
MREITLETPGKLLLFGEHAAVYGFPALGIPLDRGVRLTYRPGSDWTFRIFTGALPGTPLQTGDTAHDTREIPLPPGVEGFFPHLQEVLSRALPRLGATGGLPPGTLELQARLPLGSGFGSSAALCTALARLGTGWAREAEQEPAPPRQVWHIAHELERFFHGTPSGIDTGLSTLESPRAFFFSPEAELPRAEPLAVPRLNLVAGSIPRRRKTAELIAAVAERRRTSPTETDALLHNLGEIAQRVLTKGSPLPPEAWGQAAEEAQEALRSLDLSTPELDHLLREGRRAGALGGKLSGAGGGGAFFLVCPPGEGGDTPVLRALAPHIPPGGTLFPVRT